MQISFRRLIEHRCASALVFAAVSARGAHTTMSNSGVSGSNHRGSPRINSENATADCRQESSIFANSPPRSSGNSCCVAHSATADAPGREHSRVISPRCRSRLREIGVRRFVLVERADRRIAKQHASAAVWLQPVLMRIDYHESAAHDLFERGASFRRKIARQSKISAVGRVHVNAESVLLAQFQNFRQWVNRACAGRAHASPPRTRRRPLLATLSAHSTSIRPRESVVTA